MQASSLWPLQATEARISTEAVTESYMDRGNSGAIIVGAGSSDTLHTKRHDSTYGSRVDLQAWGKDVATTGYGDLAEYGNDENQSYTDSFNGTSSAAACVAGAVVLLQSYAKNQLGTLFTPEEMKAHLQAYSHEQSGDDGNIGPALAVKLASQELPDRPMQIELSSQEGEHVGLSCWGLPFRNHTIQASTNLIDWTDITATFPGSKSEINVLLENELGDSKKFYRLSQD